MESVFLLCKEFEASRWPGDIRANLCTVGEEFLEPWIVPEDLLEQQHISAQLVTGERPIESVLEIIRL